jgi:hypothetical protein
MLNEKIQTSKRLNFLAKKDTIPMTNNRHFFAEYLFIIENKRFGNLKFIFLEFQQLKNKYANYTLSCVILIINPCVGQLKKKSQIENSILNNFNKRN